MWGAIAAAAISAFASSRESSRGRKEEAKYSMEAEAVGGLESRRTAEYQADLLDYYKQLDKDRRKKALYSYTGLSAPSDLMGSKPVADQYPHNSPLQRRGG